MPELPDLQVYQDALTNQLRGQILQALRIQSIFVLRSVTPTPQEFVGRPLVEIRRIGKRLVLGFSGAYFAVIHLMIAGRLVFQEHRRLHKTAALCGFDFEHGTLILTEVAKKKRASLHLVSGEEALRSFDPGGIDVLSASPQQFQEKLCYENHTLKRALTDPHLFSGIGNAYSDEILFSAKLSPVRLTSRLTPAEISTLYRATQETLSTWVQRLRAESAGAFPKKVTAFRQDMAVHGRFGKPCRICGSPIQRIVHSENECNYCATCQTDGKLLADRALSRLLKSDWPRTLEEMENLKVRIQS